MNYEIIRLNYNEYQVYYLDELVFTGTLVEVNAWISLKEKGFKI